LSDKCESQDLGDQLYCLRDDLGYPNGAFLTDDLLSSSEGLVDFGLYYLSFSFSSPTSTSMSCGELGGDIDFSSIFVGYSSEYVLSISSWTFSFLSEDFCLAEGKSVLVVFFTPRADLLPLFVGNWA